MNAAAPTCMELMARRGLRAGDAWRTIDADLQRDAVPPAQVMDDLLGMATALLGMRRAILAIGDDSALRIVAAIGEREVPTGVLAPADAAEVDVHAVDAPAALQPTLLDACGLRTCVRMRIHDRDGDPLGVLLVGDASRTPAAGLDLAPARRLARLAGELLERERLQRRARICEQILQTGFEPVIVADRAGEVAFVNRAAAALLGNSARGLRGMPLSVLFPTHLQADAAAVAQWLAGGGDASEIRLNVGAAGTMRAMDAVRCRWSIGDGHGLALMLRETHAA